MSIEVNLELLGKYFSGRCSGEEEAAVHAFLKKPESEALLNEWLSIRSAEDWSLFESNNAIHPDNGAWKQQFHQRIGVAPVKTKSSVLRSLLSVRNAAIWAGILVSGFIIYYTQHAASVKKEQLVWMEKTTQNGQRSRIQLSDSSIVYLGAGSTFRFPGNFSGASREVYLTGEAFFDIHNKVQQPFIVHTGRQHTQVLGTSFKIEAFAGKPLAVQVATGKVRVDEVTATGRKILAVLTPGERITCFEGQTRKDKVVSEDIVAWKDARLSFNNQSLAGIAATLERWYNVKVTFKNAAKAKENLTLLLDANAPIDKVFRLLASAAHFKYIINDKQIIIH